MLQSFKRIAIVVFATTCIQLFFSPPQRAAAQSYPIDCAILLCLSGGWPTSAPCEKARSEFIRRITPWPVEPPLQIWRCPMGASLDQQRGLTSNYALINIRALSNSTNFPRSNLNDVVFELKKRSERRVPTETLPLFANSFVLQLIKDGADIDISGPEFNFVRSIRVFDVRYASQAKVSEAEICRRIAIVYLGTYGTQGDFSWQVSNIAKLPDAHHGLEGWGENCPSLFNRSVFVDWRDFEGTYGFQQVNY